MSFYPNLFAPFESKRLKSKNRIVMLPHGTGMTRNGEPTEEDLAYYEARARAGVGIIIAGGMIVHPSARRRTSKSVELYQDRVVTSLSRKAKAIQQHGARIFGQLYHMGREMLGAEFENAPVAPSAVRSPRDPFAPRALEADEIRSIIAGYGESASHVLAGGFDGIEIHGAHGYLVAQFLSPATNFRSDEWGGDRERRFRFLKEIIETIRTKCGDDFPLGVRLSADEELPDGLGIADTARIAEAIAATGAVDYLDVTIGVRGAYVKDATVPPAPAARAAKILREASGVPVIVGQRITRPDLAEQLLTDGVADFVGMTRALIADAEWTAKAARGEAARIRPCIGLLQDCRYHAPHLHCAANPITGRELRPEFTPGLAAMRRRIAVVGGGPAGLEAARTAAECGHDVTLFETSDGLGGQFLYASSLPHRSDLRGLLDFLAGELRLAKVQIKLETPVTGRADLAGYDVAIVATGARPKPLPDEIRGERVFSWFDVLEKGAPEPGATGRVVLVDDGTGFWWTYGVAEMLIAAGWRVLVTAPGPAIAHAIPHESINPLLARLGRAGTEFAVLTILDEPVEKGAQLMNVTSGETRFEPCDLIVVQTGRDSQLAVGASLRASGIEVHEIGDCVAPRRLSHALYEAQRTVRLLKPRP